VSPGAAAGIAAGEMEGSGDTKECTRCGGRGKYAARDRGPLVQITCDTCDGSGRVPADAPDEPPAKEPNQIPFG
jgi:DnaJ-class molecular chaperone